MALNWDLTKIEDFEDLWEKVEDDWRPGFMDTYTVDEETGVKKRLNTVTNSLIWYCMSVHLHGITEKNYEEFFQRMQIVDRVTGGPMLSVTENGHIIPRPISLSEIKRHIGLSTNVGNIPRRQFMSKMNIQLRNHAGRVLYDEKKRLEKENEE